MRFLKAKVPSIKNIRSSALSRHPREYLEELANLVAYQLYGVEYKQQIVRQEKDIRLKEGHYIDYVFTCFELANVLGQPPPKVALAIADGINKWIARSQPAMVGKFTAEAVNGYVNFELSDEYIAEAAYYVAHWLQKPQSRLIKNRTAHIITQGPALGGDPNAQPANKALSFVHELYTGAGCKIKSRYILSDASEDAVKLVVDKLMSNYKVKKKKLNADIEVTKRRREIRNAVSGLDEQVSPAVNKQVQVLRKEFLENVEKIAAKELEDKADISSESKIAQKVHDWLDKSVRKHQHILSDGHSRAVYYHINMGPLAPLRSASGLLFEASYLLYSLEVALEDTKPGRDLVIAIVPQKHHQLLYSHAEIVSPNISYKSFICVDAKQAHTDMPKTQNGHSLLAATYKDIAHTLGGAVAKKIHNTTSRAYLLALIDFPVELNYLAMQVRLLEAISLVGTDAKLSDDLKG